MVSTFFYSLAGGMLGVLATGRPDQIAWRFLRFAALVAFGMLSGVSAWKMFAPADGGAATLDWTWWLGTIAAIAAALVVFAAPVAIRAVGAYRLVCVLGGLSAVAAASISAVSTLDPTSERILPTVLVIASQALGSLLLGSITVAWLLGHAYLTATRMTIAPLRHFSRILSLAVAIRLAFVVVTVGLAWTAGQGDDGSIFTVLKQSWLIVTMRLAVGLIAVAAFAYMVADCVRLRSTQSATGILYFGSVFAYVGELACQQLIAECGWPI